MILSFKKKITDLLIDFRLHLDYDLLSGLWYADDSFNKADIIFDEVAKQNDLILTPLFLERAFLNFDDDGEMFLQWAQNKVKEISKDNEYMLLFELVSRCSCANAINIYKEVVIKRIPIDLYKIIISYPSILSWSGSEVNAVNEKIKKFNLILSTIPEGIKYLEYKDCLNDNINKLKKYCKEVLIREKLDFFDNY